MQHESVDPTISELLTILQPERPPPYEDTDPARPIRNDGRIDLHFNDENARISRYFRDKSRLDRAQPQHDSPLRMPTSILLKLNILMLVVGSRGDVQPFVAIAQALQRDGHKVRLATHPDFRLFVESHNVEFFNIGGNPSELMAYMVQNPGLVPKFTALCQGQVQRQRRTMEDITNASWRACFESGSFPPENSFRHSVNYTRKPRSKRRNPKPFIADMIIANPPASSHIHCAERLGVPLHIVFTMPWSPTEELSHPLANIKSSNKNIGQINYLSYLLVESMIWQGLGSMINRFRCKVLGLDPVHPSKAPAMLHSLRIPHTYCWSPSLLPKPADWHSNIAISGYAFLESAVLYDPPLALRLFLESGPPPVYVGFGSIVVDDPSSLTNIVIEAIRKTGNRAIISAGWSSLGRTAAGYVSTSPDILIFHEDCPHDWLFPQVSCVVHHGGAGTTAAGLKAGRPTVVVPFFGDQFFWGDIIYRAGAGPRPIPYRSITTVALADAITMALQDDTLGCAKKLREHIKSENGIKGAVQNIYAHLPLTTMGCSLIPTRTAAWRSKSNGAQLSALAATVLRKEKLLDWSDLVLHHSLEHNVAHGPFEPVSGAIWAVTELFYDSFRGMAEILTEVGRVPVLGHRLWETMHANRKRKKIGNLENEEVSEYSVPVTDQVSVRYAKSEEVEMLPKKHKLPGEYMLTGSGRILAAAARAPGTFTTAMAQGAHNMPLMWGDSKVRPAAKVTGIASGVKGGCRELALGVYDGVSGLFMQPISGLLEDGPKGFLTGTAKGVVGLPVKFFAAASGIVGYPLKGVDIAVSNAFKPDPVKAIRDQRMLQGEHEYLETSEQVRKDVVDQWRKILAKQ